MLSTRGDKVPWRPFKTLPGPASFVHIAPFKCQAKVPSLLANCTTCTLSYFVGKQLERVLVKVTFCLNWFPIFLLFVQFPPNNAIISNGQWKIRAHTERRGSPPPQRSNTANVIYVMCTLYPPPNTIVKPPTSWISFPFDNFNLIWKLNFHVKQEENPVSIVLLKMKNIGHCSKWNFDLEELQGSLL